MKVSTKELPPTFVPANRGCYLVHQIIVMLNRTTHLTRPPVRISRCIVRLPSLLFVAFFAFAMGATTMACTDTTGLSDEDNTRPGNGDSDAGNGGGGDDGGTGHEGDGGDGEDAGEPCEGMECDQVACPPDQPVTSLAGTVYIPSGQLPLPNAYVYIPTEELAPLPEGASCQPCTEIVSGSPLVQTTTNHLGEFYLENVPATDEVPLVIQSGKWRRTITISNIDECTVNTINDPEKLRLPRNRNEGNIPRVAVTTGNSDALECLVNKVGLDDSEFGVAGSDASVHIYSAGGSTGFSDGFNNGADFPSGTQWWSELAGVNDYDIVLFSCHYPSPFVSGNAAQALEAFTHLGGRAFMTDQQKSWLESGPNSFRNVAGWQGFSGPYDRTGIIDTSFAGGQQMAEWMNAVGALTGQNSFPAVELWDNIAWINQDVARRWIYTSGDQTAYFDFHTPVGAEGSQQCGRVVYSDLHVASAGNAEPWGRFPDNCNDQTQSLSSQEKALVYMFFDLGACIIPDDCTPLTCAELGEGCGIFPDGCGGTVDCGECDGKCSQIGQSCTQNSDCCSQMCGIGAGDDVGECIIG